MLVFGRPVQDFSEQSLEDRIKAFLSRGPEAENLDGPSFVAQRAKGKIADFTLWNRRLILEVKAPKADPRGRLANILTEAMAEEPRMFAFGRVGVVQILRSRENGSQINRRMLTNGTRNIRQLLQKANRQIKETQEKLGVGSSAGVVVMPVEAGQPLEIGVVAYSIRQALEAEIDRLSHVNFVWAPFESHTVRLDDGSFHFPELIVWRKDSRPTDDAHLVTTMMDAWANSNGAEFVHVDHSAGWDALKPYGEGWPLVLTTC